MEASRAWELGQKFEMFIKEDEDIMLALVAKNQAKEKRKKRHKKRGLGKKEPKWRFSFKSKEEGGINWCQSLKGQKERCVSKPLMKIMSWNIRCLGGH